jgi:hypothetical protein
MLPAVDRRRSELTARRSAPPRFIRQADTKKETNNIEPQHDIEIGQGVKRMGAVANPRERYGTPQPGMTPEPRVRTGPR